MSEQIIREIDALNVTMNGGSTLLNVVLALVMFGVALGIKPRTFVDIVKSHKSFISMLRSRGSSAYLTLNV